MYKKAWGVFVAALLIMALAGCGSNGNSNSNSGSSSDGNSKASNGGDSVELKMVFWDSNQEPGLKDMAQGFMDNNPNIKVTVETIPWDQYWTKLQASATGGDLPDIVVMHPDEVENYADGGMLMDLTNMFDQSDTTRLDKFPQYVNDDFKVDGKYYGVPKDVGTLALVYNKDLFDQAGVAYPDESWTWDDMMSAAEKITDSSKGIYGIATPNDGQNYYWNLIWQNGGDLFADDGKTSTFDSPETVEAMNYAISFIQKGLSPTVKDFANLSADEYFESGKVGMMFAGSWMLPEYLAVDGLHFDVAELPSGKERAAICSGMAFSVSAKTKHPQEAMKFVEYLGTQEAQTIEAKSGVAIPAYDNTQEPWVDGFTTIDATPFVKAIDYGHTSPGLTTSNEAAAIVDNYMPQIFSLKLTPEEGLKKIASEINALNK